MILYLKNITDRLITYFLNIVKYSWSDYSATFYLRETMEESIVIGVPVVEPIHDLEEELLCIVEPVTPVNTTNAKITSPTTAATTIQLNESIKTHKRIIGEFVSLSKKNNIRYKRKRDFVNCLCKYANCHGITKITKLKVSDIDYYYHSFSYETVPNIDDLHV